MTQAVIDFEARMVCAEGVCVALTRMQLNLLWDIARASPFPVSTAVLVLREYTDSDVGCRVVINRRIASLRKRLEPTGLKILNTGWSGYTLNMPLVWERFTQDVARAA